MARYRYTGGVRAISVVCPTRTIEANPGDVVDVDGPDAAALDRHPDWILVDEPELELEPDELESRSKPELVELAQAAGLAHTGTRAALIERLRNGATTTTTPPATTSEV